MKILRERQVITESGHELFFQAKGAHRGTGFGFPCNQFGMLYARNYYGLMNDDAKRNYKHAMSGIDSEPPVVKSYQWKNVIQRIGLCECGEEVILDDFTCPCICGLDYNSAGQLLAPRQQWGEETGEHWVEVAQITWR